MNFCNRLCFDDVEIIERNGKNVTSVIDYLYCYILDKIKGSLYEVNLFSFILSIPRIDQSILRRIIRHLPRIFHLQDQYRR